MVACRYRWLAEFLPFIDIKKQKALLAFYAYGIFQLMKKQTHDRPIFKVPATNQLGLLFSNYVV